jgi:hypothetical protein
LARAAELTGFWSRTSTLSVHSDALSGNATASATGRSTAGGAVALAQRRHPLSASSTDTFSVPRLVPSHRFARLTTDSYVSEHTESNGMRFSKLETPTWTFSRNNRRPTPTWATPGRHSGSTSSAHRTVPPSPDTARHVVAVVNNRAAYRLSSSLPVYVCLRRV